jgi:Domain of unknown function (DUF4258)
MPGNGFPLRRKVVQGNLLLQLDTPIGEFKFVEIIKHALERMSERKVSEQDVLNTLRKPDEEGLSTQPGRKRVSWNKTARVAIEVVYEELTDRLRVITAISRPRRISGRR